MRLLIEKIENHSEHIAPYKLTIAGVGFYQTDRIVFTSHYGDYIGSAPIFRIEPFICFMKRRLGLIPDKYPMDYGETQRPITYGWQNLIPIEQLETWMEDLSKNPIEL